MSAYFCPHLIFNYGYLIEFVCLKIDLIGISYILRCVSAVVAKLSSWRCGNKLLKASRHLKDKSKNKKLAKSQKSKPSIA